MQARTPSPAALHAACVVCGEDHPFGLRAVYARESDGSVLAHVSCDDRWVGYPGSLHGGITTCLLDGAMVHCLFAQGVVAVTARLSVEFHGPVVPRHPLTVASRLLSGRHELYEVEAELMQLGKLRATATGSLVRMRGCEYGPKEWRRACPTGSS